MEEGWGSSTMERLARDLKVEFPDMAGFSPRNLKYMRQFAESFPDANWAAAAAQIPWGHNMLLLDRSMTPRNVYGTFSKRSKVAGAAVNSKIGLNPICMEEREKRLLISSKRLPTTQSDIANKILKDPYNFGFMTLDVAHRKKNLSKD